VGLKNLANTLLLLEEMKETSVELIGSNERATKKFATKIISKLKNLKSRVAPEN